MFPLLIHYQSLPIARQLQMKHFLASVLFEGVYVSNIHEKAICEHIAYFAYLNMGKYHTIPGQVLDIFIIGP